MQSNTIPNFVWSEVTGANDCSGNMYKAVKLNANGAAKIAAATDVVVGIQQSNPTGVNQMVTLESEGIAAVYAGAAVTKGSKVSILADGTVGNYSQSITLGGTYAENDIVTATIDGVVYTFTALATPTPTSVAAGLAAVIDAGVLSATSALGVITVTSATQTFNITGVTESGASSTIAVSSLPTTVGIALATGVAGDLLSIKLTL